MKIYIKKLTAIVLSITLSFSMFGMNVYAESIPDDKDIVVEDQTVTDVLSAYSNSEIIAKGTCGEDITWKLDEDGFLVLTGTGAMEKYTAKTAVPWYSVRADITDAVISSGISSVSDYAFYECSNMKQISIPESVEEIGTYAFYGCTGLTEITLPSGVSGISSNMFRECTGLTEMELPENITSIGTAAFTGCTGLRKINIPESVENIGTSAFTRCVSLETVKIPSGVTVIATSTFYNCSGLKSIEIPESVTSIGDGAFFNCSSLKDVYYAAGKVEWLKISKANNNTSLTNATIHYKDDLLGQGSCGEDITWVVDATGQFTITGTGAMEAYTKETLVPWYRIRKDITDVVISSGISSVSDYAFYECSNMKQISIPESVEEIGTHAFYRCTGLIEITLPSGLSGISSNMFRECTGLTEMELPENITRIGTAAFSGCTGLQKINIPEKVKSIGDSAFMNCISLETMKIPAGMTKIALRAFYNCRGLKDIEIPESVTSIEESVFYNCISLTDVYYAAGKVEWLKISISSNNTPLTKANIHYYYEPSVNISLCDIQVEATRFYADGEEKKPSITIVDGDKTLQQDTDYSVSYENNIEPGTGIIVITGINGYCGEVIKTFEIEEKPSMIITQPEDYVGLVGDTAVYKVGTSRNNLTFQWFYSTDNGLKWAKSGSNGNQTDTLEVELKAYRVGQLFRCEVKDSEGFIETTNAVKLQLKNVELKILSQPEDYVGAELDEPEFTIEAEGNGLTYQWFVSQDGGKTWAKSYTPGYNTNALKPILRAYRDGYQYYCEVADALGNVINSAPAIMSIEAGEITITKQPQDIVGAYQELYQFSVEAEGVNLKYQWYVSSNGGQTWAKSELEGFNTDTMNVRMYPYRDGYMYRCEITSGLKNVVTTREATLRLKESTVTLVSSPKDVNCVIDSTVQFQVKATGENLKYQWYVSQNNGETWAKTELEGCQTDTLTVKALKYRSGNKYRCTISDESGKTVTSGFATLIANNPSVKIISQPEDVSTTPNEEVQFTVRATGDGLYYQWYVSQNGGESWSKTGLTGNTTDTLTVAAYAYRDGNLYRCEIVDNSGTTEVTTAAVLTVIQ